MRLRSFVAFRRVAMRAAIGLVVAVGASGCAVATPAAVHADAPSEPRPPEQVARRNTTYLVLRLGERRLYMMDDDPETPLESFPIAVGREGLETPIGRFQVEELVEHPDFVKFAAGVMLKRIPPGPLNPLGERWIGFAHGEGWTIGIHGTPQPELLGQAVSHGCVRMRNADVVRIYERVEIGTRVIVEP